jgi:ArsR family transcriptional regulator
MRAAEIPRAGHQTLRIGLMHIKARICAHRHTTSMMMRGHAKPNLDAVLAALGEPTRRSALRLLHTRYELCVCELMAELGVSQSRMSRHMSTLKAAGLVLDRRDAQWVRYRRNPLVSPELAIVVTSILAADAAAQTSRRAKNLPNKSRDRAQP